MFQMNFSTVFIKLTFIRPLCVVRSSSQPIPYFFMAALMESSKMSHARSISSAETVSGGMYRRVLKILAVRRSILRS